jgi:Zn-dependent protease
LFFFRLLTGPGSFLDKIAIIIGFILVGMFSIVIHEISHGYVALLNGDDTARRQGRLSLNPVVHFQLTGVIMLLLVGFGWAKPVPVNSSNFTNYKKGMLTVSLAGVSANLIIAGILMLILFLSAKSIFLIYSTSLFFKFLQVFFYTTLTVGIKINLMLTLFNLLPIYPLDGYNVISTLFPRNIAFQQFMIKYGFILLIIVIALGYLGRLLNVPWLDIFGSFSDLVSDIIESIISSSLIIM